MDKGKYEEESDIYSFKVLSHKVLTDYKERERNLTVGSSGDWLAPP